MTNSIVGIRAHTPGPWRVEDGTALIWGDCNPDDTTNYGMGYPIAECRHTPSASWAKGPAGYQEADANARLIAAAPDLLADLSIICDLQAKTYGDATALHLAMIRVAASARAAIAKAEGRS